ncbi:hypothetical protein BCR41DRAFT_373261 [Lobosporangium transversale]|uniref:Uncharacterized protein n=1 Tax=Lobosporangium transversale TaxID=64571 RepID=A0A1Y2GIP5_9FUNG|nr:hypothetical protein BCR41DRAFT_373261 [Lobosporangium transversale]ORZ08562.1 hypothetical protein BCR41DRAFT_373261 [Lobosporangium transversale]|eukprot:XP_021878490.1 hypothetical protein BCR41DRAFT_373261 [Lobosporangium transversale]
MVSINICYGNDTAVSQFDNKIGGDASIAVRLLYGYFISNKDSDSKPVDFFLQKQGINLLSVSRAIEVIHADIIRRGTPTNNPIVLVISIDEVNHLHNAYPGTLREVVNAIGKLSLRTIEPFCIPIMAGTIQGPIEKMVMGSTYRILHLPLPLLTDDDVIEIGRRLPLTIDGKALHLTEDYLKHDILFRRSIADIGGVARAVEHFYEHFVNRLKKLKKIPDRAEELTECLRNVDIMAVMQSLAVRLDTLYPFGDYVEFMTPVVARAILGIPVKMNNTIGGGTTYKDLRTTGLINLERAEEYDMYHIRIPYLWLVLLVKASTRSESESPLKYWTTFIDPKQDVSWAGWEHFNMKFLALRLCLFSYLGKQTVTLQELFAGAEFDPEFPELKVEIPDHRNVTVHQLLETFPEHEIAKDVDGMEHTDFLQEFHKVFVNGKGAPADGFMQLRLQDRRDIASLCLLCQMKWAEEKDSKESRPINQTTIDEEITKIVVEVKEVLKERCPSLECAFGIFSNRCESSSRMGLHSHTFMVHKGNFRDYYGHTSAGRAQFSAFSRLYINSAPEHHIKHIPAVGEKICKEIMNERKKRRFGDEEDFKKRMKMFPENELASLLF